MTDLANKKQIADFLRANTDGDRHELALAAIRGLGELAGPAALKQLSDLIDTAPSTTHATGALRMAALLEALGRAGRALDD